MNAHDNTAHAQILAALSTTAECLGTPLSQAACQMMMDELTAYPPEQVLHALRDCMRTLQGRLTLAAILQRLQAQDGHPSANEAWAIALEATDEYQTVSLTPQIQQALSTAQRVLSTGDKVGARMAFLAAYERLVTQARQQQQPATWSLSIGFDAAGRQPALEAAKSAGRLTYQPDPLLALPPPTIEDESESDTPAALSGRAALFELLAEWKAEEQQQQMQQRRRALEELAQWEQKNGPFTEEKHPKTKFNEVILENKKEAKPWVNIHLNIEAHSSLYPYHQGTLLYR